jgi:hypothetical protein
MIFKEALTPNRPHNAWVSGWKLKVGFVVYLGVLEKTLDLGTSIDLDVTQISLTPICMHLA